MAIIDFNDYKANIMDTYRSLHCVISLLNDTWHGLHVLVVIYLRQCIAFLFRIRTPLTVLKVRSGIRRLMKYFASTTRPAAIELLAETLNNAEGMNTQRELARSLLPAIPPTHTTPLALRSPLVRLQERICGIVEYVIPRHVKMS